MLNGFFLAALLSIFTCTKSDLQNPLSVKFFRPQRFDKAPLSTVPVMRASGRFLLRPARVILISTRGRLDLLVFLKSRFEITFRFRNIAPIWETAGSVDSELRDACSSLMFLRRLALLQVRNFVCVVWCSINHLPSNYKCQIPPPPPPPHSLDMALACVCLIVRASWGYQSRESFLEC